MAVQPASASSVVVLSVSPCGQIVTVTLNRPEKLNALNNAVLCGLEDIVNRLQIGEDLASARVLILEGNGRAFCSGFDLSDLFLQSEKADVKDTQEGWGRLISKLDVLPQITVAALHGKIIGGGVLLATACKLRVCEQDCILKLPEIGIGIPLLWGGSSLLVREVGLSRARSWVLLSETICAKELAASGFAQIADTPYCSAQSRAREIATMLVKTSPFALAFSRDQFQACGLLLLPGSVASVADATVMTYAVSQPDIQARALAYAKRTAFKSKL